MENLIQNEDFTFQLEGSIVSASWNSHVSADSSEFIDSVRLLVAILIEKKITGLCLTSGQLVGGMLPEEIIAILEKASANIVLEKVVILESLDFLWDNNVMHLLNYIKQVANLPTKIMSFPTKAEGFKWLQEKP